MAQLKEVEASCPRKVFKTNEVKQQLDIEDMGKCILCQECQKCVRGIKGKSGYLEGINEVITIGEKEQVYRFIIEGTGALKAEDILKKALVVFKQKLRDLAGKVAQYA